MNTTTDAGIPDGYDADLYRIRHSCAHLLAQAVLELYPDANLGIGPPIENGFYYDFELAKSLTADDLAQIETILKRLIREEYDFVRSEPGTAFLLDKFSEQPYKTGVNKIAFRAERPSPQYLQAGKLRGFVPGTACFEYTRD